jgi:spore coat polysaccharide biosynthesis predicted glycosyltransferase SpsG
LKNKIISITENSESSGRGHYMRQTVLKQHLAKKNIDLEIITDSIKGITKKKNKINNSLILIDLPLENQSKIDLSKLNFATKICFDWSAEQSPDISIVVAKWADREFKFIKKIYSGFDYLVTSEDLLNLIVSKKNYCLVTVGGYLDILTVNLVRKQLKLVYSGEIFLANSGNLVNLENGVILRKNLSRKDYLQILAEAELLVTNGGTTLVEGLLLKKKIIVVPKTKYEYSFARYLAKQYSFFDIWQFNNKFPLIEIFNDYNFVLDGYGVKRVSEIIEQQIDIYA